MGVIVATGTTPDLRWVSTLDPSGRVIGTFSDPFIPPTLRERVEDWLCNLSFPVGVGTEGHPATGSGMALPHTHRIGACAGKSVNSLN
jgi:hypothetical protein